MCAATGKSRSEIQYRIQFAEQYSTHEEVSKALDTFGSWWAIITEALPDTPADNHRAEGTGENEWYTPPEYIEMAREVMGDLLANSPKTQVSEHPRGH